MDGEGNPAEAAVADVGYWIGIYTEILEMEEKVLARIKELMKTQSPRSRREVELTNLPVVASQVERFRQRLGYWQARSVQLHQLDGAGGADGVTHRRVSPGAVKPIAATPRGRKAKRPAG
jgi:hypothetical protein